MGRRDYAILLMLAKPDLLARAQIEALVLQLAALRRRQFGQSSEKLAAEADQLELRLGDLEESQAEQQAKRLGPDPRPPSAYTTLE